MKKPVLIIFYLVSLMMSNLCYAQQLNKVLHSEKDGYKWYLIYSTESNIFGIQNSDGKYLFYCEDAIHDYTCFYTNFHGNSNKAFFCIERTNKKIIPQKRKERKKYVYEVGRCKAIVDLDGNIIIPFERCYESISYIDYNRRYFKVEKGWEVCGVCDIHGNEIITPQYENIIYMVDGFHGKKKYSYDYIKLDIVLDEKGDVNSNSFNKELITDSDTHFKYYLTCQSGSFGVEDENGHTLIPLSMGFTQIQTRKIDSEKIYFLCWKNELTAAYDMDGKEIIPLSLGCCSISKYEYGGSPYIVVNKKDENNSDDFEGLYSIDGKAIVPISLNFKNIYYNDEKGYVSVQKGNKCGAYSLSGKEIVKPQYFILSYTKDGFVGEKGDGDYQKRKLGIYLPNHKALYPTIKPRHSNVTSSKKTQISSSDSNISSASSLTYKAWEENIGSSRIEYVREADGMMTQTTYIRCVCMGIGGCNFCGGTGVVTRKHEYRYIDEYYTNGTFALWVGSTGTGPTVYSGGIGYVYNTNGNSKDIREEGGYYKFGGEVVYGVKTNTFTLSKDYKYLWMGNEKYHLIDKAEYDRISQVISNINKGVQSSGATYGTGVNNGGQGGSYSRNHSSSSVYTKCTDCSGSGRCRHCKGRGTSILTGHSETCVVCNGSGKCKICYGRGKL